MKPLALFCALLLIAIPASGQSPKSPFSFGIQGDITNVNVGGGQVKVQTGTGIAGNVTDIYGFGLGGGIHVDLGIGLLSLRLQGDYITLSPNADKFNTLISSYLGNVIASRFSVSGGKIDVFEGSLNVKLVVLPLPFLKPYVTGGGGIASVSVNEAQVKLDGNAIYTVPTIASQTRLMANAGAGVDLEFGVFTLYGEIRLNYIFTDPKTTAEVPVGTIGLTF